MARKRYGQYCGLVRGAEIVGERWSLLIIRDLLVSPKRYTDLRKGLPGIPTNILAARLKELEGAGVVQRRVLPRPDGSVVYELTDYGRELDEIVLALGRWGAKSMTKPQPGDIVTVDSMIMALRSTFRADTAGGVHLGYELRLGDIVIHALIDDGDLEVAEGGKPNADLVIESGPAIKALMAREMSPAEALAGGSVRLAGDPELLTRFVELFRI